MNKIRIKKREIKKKKSIVAQRKSCGAVCSCCFSPDYKMTDSEVYIGGKPTFTCGSCGNTWQYGVSGGKYGRLA